MKISNLFCLLITSILWLSCNKNLHSFEGFWCTDIEKTNLALYSELFFSEDSVVVSTPYKGTETKDYQVLSDSMIKIGSKTHYFKFYNKHSILFDISIGEEIFIKDKSKRNLDYDKRYIILQISYDTSLTQKVKDSLINDVKIGLFPKIITNDFIEEIPID